MTMRVLFIPGYSGNPYQEELAQALRAFDVEVEGIGGLGPAGFFARLRLFSRFDVVHLHWTHGYIKGRTRRERTTKAIRFLACIVAARARGTRFVWTIHNLIAHDNPDPAVETRFARTLVAVSGGAIVHCESAAREVSETYGLGRRARRKLAVIPHGNYIDTYADRVSVQEARDRLDLSGAGCVFLYFGQIRPYKGLGRLLEAFEEADLPGARLVIAGRPKGSRYAERIAERARADARIHLSIGYVPDDEVQLYLKAADAVVLPYERSLTSGAAVLAMSFGRAVVMPAMGCAVETLGHQSDLLYDPADEREPAAALRRALDSDLGAIGERNRAEIAPATWEVVAAATAAVYERGSR
jgi:glycosyltransferase involved in cell wall biosynthesis